MTLYNALKKLIDEYTRKEDEPIDYKKFTRAVLEVVLKYVRGELEL